MFKAFRFGCELVAVLPALTSFEVIVYGLFTRARLLVRLLRAEGFRSGDAFTVPGSELNTLKVICGFSIFYNCWCELFVIG